MKSRLQSKYVLCVAQRDETFIMQAGNLSGIIFHRVTFGSRFSKGGLLLSFLGGADGGGLASACVIYARSPERTTTPLYTITARAKTSIQLTDGFGTSRIFRSSCNFKEPHILLGSG